MNKVLGGALGLALLTCVNAAAEATSPLHFSFTTPAVSAFNNDRWCVLPSTGCKLTGSLTSIADFDLSSAGESHTFDFADLSVSWGLIGGDDSATISATLGFLDPISGSVSNSGDIQYATFAGIVSGGTLHWNTGPQVFTTGDGSQFSVVFNDLTGIVIGNTAHATATITADLLNGGANSDPRSAVPEPASWAMMLIGFGAMGGLMRRRTARVSFARG